MTTLADVKLYIRWDLDNRDQPCDPAHMGRMIRLVEAADRLRDARRCPHCHDEGYVVKQESYGNAEQEQCEFCYCNEDSIFQRKAAIDAIEAEK